jgi:hypothetical protein
MFKVIYAHYKYQEAQFLSIIKITKANQGNREKEEDPKIFHHH